METRNVRRLSLHVLVLIVPCGMETAFNTSDEKAVALY